MSIVANTRSVRTTYPARLLLIDYGLNEQTVQGICHGLDQLFSIITMYVGIQYIPMFGMIVNGQNQSEIFLSFSSTKNLHMDLQLSLYKLQLLAQKRSSKTISSSSWHSTFQLASIEINNNRNQITEFELIVLTNRLSNTIISDIHQCTQNHRFDGKKIELICINTDENIESIKQSITPSDSINIRYISENRYSISLYFKSWLMNNDHENEHIQLYLPLNRQTEYIDQSWHLIRCDLQEILIDPRYHLHHDRFFLYSEPLIFNENTLPSLTLPIYQLKGLNFIKQRNLCISMTFGMPIFLLSTACQKYDRKTIETNANAFYTLIKYLRDNELMLICRLNDCSTMNQSFSGHFILSIASDHCLILRSIASSELLLPFPNFNQQQKQIDENLMESLVKMNIDEDIYNPLFYESRKSKIILNTNLI